MNLPRTTTTKLPTGDNPMRTITALALAGLLAGCAANIDNITTASVPAKASSVVRVNLKDGHGSGVYIGNGVVLTAGHVGVGQTGVVLKLDNGTEQKADVLWVNTTYDVAAVLVSKPDALRAAPLACGTPKIGAKVTAAGSPGYDDFVYLGGNVAGKVRKKGDWQEVIPVPIAGGAQGISGGPLFDEYGQVVGIVVGEAIAPLARTDEPKSAADYDLSQTGMMYVVPGATVCMLLGRSQ